jgi:ankyrin repeat protein
VDGYAPLRLALHFENLVVIKMLLDYGADINQVGEVDGYAPLRAALVLQKFDFAELFIEYGAMPTGILLADLVLPAGVMDIINCALASRVDALEGFTRFRLAIKEGILNTPLAQWVPVLPPDARAELSDWVTSLMSDSSACYAAFFRPINCEEEEEEDSFPSSSATCLLRDQIGHDGIIHIRRLVISYLVVHNPKTRKIIRECEAFGSQEVATPMQVAEAVKRVAKVRAVWPN